MPQSPAVDSPSLTDPNSDLGFGAVVARESRKRFLNRDGSFNVRRTGLRLLESLSPYHTLMTMSWTRFLALFTATYLTINALFALAFVACGPGTLVGNTAGSSATTFADAFFFSVHTLGTIGYGNVSPASTPANLLVTLESLLGMLGVALATGIIFARFSRPTARILFSDRGLIAPYGDSSAFMFRIANRRSSQIVELQAKLLLTRRRKGGGGRDRDFFQLKLERDRVAFFPLSWTIVHPINAESPLFGLTPGDLHEIDAEFLILLSGFDETFSQVVHARSSYKADEIVFGARFRSMFKPAEVDDADITVDVRAIHTYDVEGRA